VLPRPVTVVVVCLLTAVWIANVIIGWLQPDRAIDGLNTLCGTIVGGALLLDKPAKTVARVVADRFLRPAPADDQANGED
jgi:DNA-binding transcriptional regulator of glucitol operon